MEIKAAFDDITVLIAFVLWDLVPVFTQHLFFMKNNTAEK